MGFRVEPTPGSTTPRWMVLGGNTGQVDAIKKPPRRMSWGASSCERSIISVLGFIDKMTPFTMAAYGSAVPKSEQKVITNPEGSNQFPNLSCAQFLRKK